MSELQSDERLVELHGWSAGEAAAKLVELATQQGYNIAATAPGTYRLARTRRKLFGKRTESVVASVFTDRTGTKARIVGPLDPAIVDHLTHGSRPSAGAPVASAPTAAPQPATPPSPPPTPPAPAAAPPPAPAAAPPPAPPHTYSQSPPQHAPIISAPPWMPSSQPSPASDPDDHDDRTIARSALRRPSAGPATLTLPDGRTVPLEQPVVIGRNPDPSLGPPASVPVAIADSSISKSHAVVTVADGIVWVTDLHSTNGTSVEASGASTPCTPGDRHRVEPGATIVAGDVRLSVGGTS